MSAKTNPRRRAEQQKRMLRAAVRRAERRGNSLDATWARAQLELRTGEIMPAKNSTDDNSGEVFTK